MYPNFIVDVLTTTDAERRRRQEAAWRARARRPDAPPLPDEPPRSRAQRLSRPRFGLASALVRLAGWTQLIRR